MTKITDILNFAAIHKEFTRKELIMGIMSEDQVSSPGTLSEQLKRLVNSGQLIRTDRGSYKFSNEKRNDFLIVLTKDLELADQKIKRKFPFVNYCLWSSATLIPYMHHIPNLNILFIDVEREASEAVFNLFNAENSKRVMVRPSLTEFERYIDQNETIIIRTLISESPLQIVNGISVPTLEKILVDIIGDVEFSFLQGSELFNIYDAIFQSHNINRKRLMRYAARRGRKEEVEQLLITNKL